MIITGLPNDAEGLTLEHNPGRAMYQTVEQYLEGEMPCDWESSEHRQRAIATNEIWLIRWYPDTTIGFIELAAPTLDELCSFVARVLTEEASSSH